MYLPSADIDDADEYPLPACPSLLIETISVVPREDELTDLVSEGWMSPCGSADALTIPVVNPIIRINIIDFNFTNKFIYNL